MYWKTIADQGYNVGIVNTLHSSPADSYINNQNYDFVIPDCFASNNLTKLKIYEDFQALNTSATSENSRATTMNFPRQKAFKTLLKYPALGIKSKTLLDAVGLVASIKTGKVNKERLRNLQFTYDLGFRQILVEDHHSGRHYPEGSLIIYNSKSSSKNQAQDTIDYLEYAPAMLKFFGLNRPNYMPEPQFTI